MGWSDLDDGYKLQYKIAHTDIAAIDAVRGSYRYRSLKHVVVSLTDCWPLLTAQQVHRFVVSTSNFKTKIEKFSRGPLLPRSPRGMIWKPRFSFLSSRNVAVVVVWKICHFVARRQGQASTRFTTSGVYVCIFVNLHVVVGGHVYVRVFVCVCYVFYWQFTT